MTEIPTTPTEPESTQLESTPAEATPPVSPNRSRRRLIIAIAAGLVVAVVAFVGVQFALTALNANAVTLYTSEAENYSVMAPGEPTQEQGAVLPLGLPKTATHWTDGELYYSVSSADGTDLPPTPVWRGMFLHDLLVGALSDAPGVSASSLQSSAVTDAFSTQPEEITLSGAPAFRFTLTLEGAPAPFYVVFSGHDPRLYILVYTDSADSRDEDFIDSFTFLD
jgi:hypothetical protein